MDREPMFTRHVKRAYPRVDELAAAAEAVQATIDSPGWRIIQELIAAELSALDDLLDDPNRVLEQASYAAKHALRGGLKGAQAAAETLIVIAVQRLEEERARHETEAPVGAGARG